MNSKLITAWSDFSREIIINKRELLLGFTVCSLAGVVIGMILSPRKNVMIASHNGNTTAGNSAAPSQEPGNDAPASEAAAAE